MANYRPPTPKSQYWIPKEDYLTAIHYALRYPLWKEELESMVDTSRGICYDKDKVQSSNDFDSTFEAAVRIAERNTHDKIKMIDEIIAQVADDMDYYLRLGVCYGLTFQQLKGKGMPCERDKYYVMRRHFYYELSRRI